MYTKRRLQDWYLSIGTILEVAIQEIKDLSASQYKESDSLVAGGN